MKSRSPILIIGSEAISLLLFRGPLLRSMVAAGNSVHAAAKTGDIAAHNRLAEMGVLFHPIQISRAGLNPFIDLLTFRNLVSLIRQVRPHMILSYTIKPVIYGGLAARLCGVKSIYSLITGLGYTFMESRSLIQSFSGILARKLYRLSLKKDEKVFFQNSDDLALFLEKGFVRSNQAVLVNGSGVNLDYYVMSELPDEPVFLMISRLLADKGIREYVKAAGKVKKRFPKTRFILCGGLDPNPNSIRERELRQWKGVGIIEHLGYLDDVRPAIQNCRCYVLPSYYREGIPRTVLEAMSIGRPIITTDAPGCRETVLLTPEGRHARDRGEGVMIGENGFLVRVRDAEALAKAMQRILEAPSLAERMGKRSREIAEHKFDVKRINAIILSEMGLIC